LVPVKAAEAKEIYEIAARLQQRITAIMRYAAQSGIISYNPATDMAGALTTVKRQHRPALALNRISELLERLDATEDNLSPDWQLNLPCLSSSVPVNCALPGGLRSTLRKPCGPFLLSDPIDGVKYSHRG
jgi:integrase